MKDRHTAVSPNSDQSFGQARSMYDAATNALHAVARRHRMVLARQGISLLAVAHCADEYAIFQSNNEVGGFNFFEPQFAPAVAAA
jgi:hypothetical protein